MGQKQFKYVSQLLNIVISILKALQYKYVVYTNCGG